MRATLDVYDQPGRPHYPASVIDGFRLENEAMSKRTAALLGGISRIRQSMLARLACNGRCRAEARRYEDRTMGEEGLHRKSGGHHWFGCAT